MKNAIIYTRFSPRPDSKNCDSCRKQRDRCEAYCVDNGYNTFPSYNDKATSGGVLNRPQLTAAINRLKKGWVLLVDRPDRLSRDLLDTLLIRRQVAEKGAEIAFADGSPSGVGSPEEVFFSNVMAALAAYERDRIIHRCNKGKEKGRKEGKFCGGKLKIGWMIGLEGRVTRCLAERSMIIRICKWANEGETSEQVRHTLSTMNYSLCRGQPWSARTIRKIIARESYWAGPSGDRSLEPTTP